ncbi:hypothetical protein AV530_018145 [Patagioenas fasciata monilis]|uniref:Uncharacterized protein n=1 Tax=Patagioenas fasciata monilis TaxID=372326 RepID=A0A1V4KL11_PATFA|nr:hypothetical protein AV530_018145 [Patagioenas fasciata monilis]
MLESQKQVMLFTRAHTDSVIINLLRACVKEVPYSSSWGWKRSHAKAPCLWAFPHIPTSSDHRGKEKRGGKTWRSSTGRSLIVHMFSDGNAELDYGKMDNAALMLA